MEKSIVISDCKKCKGTVETNTFWVLYSCPPKYKSICKDCGNVGYPFCSDVDKKE